MDVDFLRKFLKGKKKAVAGADCYGFPLLALTDRLLVFMMALLTLQLLLLTQLLTLLTTLLLM
ncbi:MAG: hypothetical protein AB1489_39020 [Acidobacteriota bacterium]